jgi:hypothetical protein
MYNDVMTSAEQRAYVRRWVETGRMLDELRWRELRALDDATALAATDGLIEMALRVPVPRDRWTSSGLVEQQALFQRSPKR